MSDSLGKRVTRLETGVDAQGDWRQFGSDPRDMPDWALELAVREEADQLLKLVEAQGLSLPEVGPARAALEAGDLDEAINMILNLDRMMRAQLPGEGEGC